MELDRLERASTLHQEYIEANKVLTVVEKGDDPIEPWSLKAGRNTRQFFSQRIKDAVSEAIRKVVDDINAEIEAM